MRNPMFETDLKFSEIALYDRTYNSAEHTSHIAIITQRLKTLNRSRTWSFASISFLQLFKFIWETHPPPTLCRRKIILYTRFVFENRPPNPLMQSAVKKIPIKSVSFLKTYQIGTKANTFVQNVVQTSVTTMWNVCTYHPVRARITYSRYQYGMCTRRAAAHEVFGRGDRLVKRSRVTVHFKS